MNNDLTRRTYRRLVLKAGALLVFALYAVPGVLAQTVNQGVGRGTGGRWTVDFAGSAQPVTVSGTVTVTFTMPSLVAGSALIGHVITDSGSTTAVTGNVTVVQPTGSNLHVAVDSAPTTAVTNANLDVALSTRLKPADTLAGVTTVAAVTSITNPVAVTNSGLSNIPAQGQAIAAGSLPVVLPAAQITALTPPAAITNFANETGGNLANIKTDVDRLDIALSALRDAIIGSGPKTLTDVVTALANLTNLDVALSTRLKPADTLAAVTTLGSITNTVTVDSELSAAVALSDTLSNPTAGGVGSYLLAWDTNASQWRRATIKAGGQSVTGSDPAIVVSISPNSALSAQTDLTQVNFTAVSSNRGVATDGSQRVAVAIDSTKGTTQAATMVLARNVDTTLLASNTSRAGFTVCNQSSSPLLLKFGTGATEFSYNVRVKPGACYENGTYNGVVDGFWFAGADNYAMVSEST
jgi:hypothetical protein